MNVEQIKKTDYFLEIKNTVENLYNSGLVGAGSGYCLSMSDIVHKLLHQRGIESHLVECGLMVTIKDPPGLYLVGYTGFHENDFDKETKMENHIVCVTDTPVPILIDTSISHVDKKIKYICEPIVKKEIHTNIAEFEFSSSTWMYQEKPESELPNLHQRSIIDRINTDNKFKKQISFIQKFMIVLLGVSSLNFIRGTYDFYQTYVNKTNSWGPYDHRVDK
jgi:hypothetical protein